MKKSLDADLVLEIANELAVDPSFIEKDYYAVQAIVLISNADFEGITPIFSGGTSLSKGYELIQRFSEDIDFRLVTSHGTTRGQRRNFRKQVEKLINDHEELTIVKDSEKSHDENNFFSFDIHYPQTIERNGALRANLRLEMRFQNIQLSHQEREVISFINKFQDQTYETIIACLSPTETAADKFSALLWRIQARNRAAPIGETANDPTIIRHLHDLHALRDFVADINELHPLVLSAYEDDKGRGASDANITLREAIDIALKRLQSEVLEYEREYQQFVEAVSYATDDERITFQQAVSVFQTLCSELKQL